MHSASMLHQLPKLCQLLSFAEDECTNSTAFFVQILPVATPRSTILNFALINISVGSNLMMDNGHIQGS